MRNEKIAAIWTENYGKQKKKLNKIFPLNHLSVRVFLEYIIFYKNLHTFRHKQNDLLFRQNNNTKKKEKYITKESKRNNITNINNKQD